MLHLAAVGALPPSEAGVGGAKDLGSSIHMCVSKCLLVTLVGLTKVPVLRHTQGEGRMHVTMLSGWLVGWMVILVLFRL